MDADDEFGDFSGADAEALTAALAAAERRATCQSQKPTATPATSAAQASSSLEGIKQQQPQQPQQQQPAPVPVVQQPAPQKSLRPGPSAIIVNTRQVSPISLNYDRFILFYFFSAMHTSFRLLANILVAVVRFFFYLCVSTICRALSFSLISEYSDYIHTHSLVGWWCE